VTQRPTIVIVGAGSLAHGLAPALCEAGYKISEIVSRRSPDSRTRTLAAKCGAQATQFSKAKLEAQLVWLCVPDREIRLVARALADRSVGKIKFAFHSSGALAAGELSSLKRHGIACASAHPLMTFVPGSAPGLKGVPFALEGDGAAVRVARQIVRALGGEPFVLLARRKAAYHAWATMTSPLLLAFLVTLEDAARAAGLKKENSRRMSLPIIRQTLANYSALGPDHSFSGPIIRGDTATVARHLAELKRVPTARKVYVELARAALRGLPSRSKNEQKKLLLTKKG
jgi:predicted short-subunit dehydrogenase-like oxidoreductase (DUF2520 family)